MGTDDEAALDSCTAYDTMPAAASLPPPSVIRPTPPNVVQVPVGPGAGSGTNPVLSPVTQPVTPPPVPQLPQRTDSVVGQERVVDPNDKGFSFSGTWDTSGPNRAPRVTGVSADVPSTSPRIHGDPA